MVLSDHFLIKEILCKMHVVRGAVFTGASGPVNKFSIIIRRSFRALHRIVVLFYNDEYEKNSLGLFLLMRPANDGNQRLCKTQHVGLHRPLPMS